MCCPSHISHTHTHTHTHSVMVFYDVAVVAVYFISVVVLIARCNSVLFEEHLNVIKDQKIKVAKLLTASAKHGDDQAYKKKESVSEAYISRFYQDACRQGSVFT